MILTILPIICVLLVLYWRRRISCQSISSKNILVIGGTSGLGLEVARQLFHNGNSVTVTSRSLERAQEAVNKITNGEETSSNPRIRAIKVDVNDEKDFHVFNSKYEYIFYMPGFAVVKYFENQSITDFRKQMELNFLSAMSVLLHFQKKNFPFTYVVAGSTAGWFHFPGYSSYAPTKAALKTFMACAEPELKKKQVSLCVFACPTMNTPGLRNENRDKPEYTWSIERSNDCIDPKNVAEYLLCNIGSRKVLAMDWFTYLAVIREECEGFVDCLFFPVAVIAIFIARCYTIHKFRKVSIN